MYDDVIEFQFKQRLGQGRAQWEWTAQDDVTVLKVTSQQSEAHRAGFLLVILMLF